MGKNKSRNESNLFLWVVLPILFAVLIPVLRTKASTDPLSYMYPNFLLFTAKRNQTRELWEKLIKIDTGINYDHPHIPIIDVKDYTFESLRKATENFRYPAIVRGMFNNTPGQVKWQDLDYLPSRLGSYNIPVVQNAEVGKLQNDRIIESFSDAFRDVLTNDLSKKYLFFPVKSRFNFNGSDLGSLERLQKDVDEVVREDLQLDRIWKGFGTKDHSTFFGAQLIVGRGQEDSDATTGTGWHCAAGNNWFAQVVGAKRWYFMDPKYSALMHPLRGGKVNMMTGSRRMAEWHQHLPLRYADVIAGDLLYNPDWEWHTIRNYKGLSIGVPIREVNMTLSMQNNLQYTAIIAVNKLLERFGLDIGGYPPN